MKKILLFTIAFILGSIGTLYIRQIFAEDSSTQVTTTEQKLTHLKIPQPQLVVLGNMQQLDLPITVAAPPQGQKSTFAGMMKPLGVPQVLGVADTGPKTSRYPRMSIAIVGDSMVDTMGTNLPYLQLELSKVYPATVFTLLNYGIGSTNIDTGLDRLQHAYSYQDRAYPPITTVKPDVAIIESFAYNPLPLSDDNLAHHANMLTQMIQTLQAQSSSKVMLLATITPNSDQFGLGPGGVNWDSEAQTRQTDAINAYLKNTFQVAKTLKIPIIDAYYPSQDLLGNGLLNYISAHDHIHPSVAGHEFIAKRIVETFITSRILE